MKWVLAAVLVMSIPTLINAAEGEEKAHRDLVLDCVARMDVQTTWDQCRTLMFQPCATHKVGGEDHLACLNDDRLQWVATMHQKRADLDGVLTVEGNMMLMDLLGQWFGFVGQKCAKVGKEKAEISEEAGKSGCEISELVGLSAELEACKDGRSVGPYCMVKE